MNALVHSTDRDHAHHARTGRRHRALVVSQVFPPAVGGSGHLLEGVYARFQHGDVHVLTDAAAGHGAGARADHLRVERVPMSAEHWGLLNVTGLRAHVTLARAIWTRCLAVPTVVHCGRALPEGIAASMAAAMPGGPKFLFWAHGEEITTALTSRDFTFAMRRVHRTASAAIANSEHTAQVLESVGMPRSKVRVIYPGVDTARFSPHADSGALRRRLLRDGDTLMLSVGRCQPRKGFDLAIRAFAALAADLPGLRHVIVGDGEERPALETLAADLGVAGRVTFTGTVSAADLPRYFAACDFFVHPNRVVAHDFEGFGLVFLEAAAAARPAIGGATGGVREAIEDGVTGILVSGTDVEELTSAIRMMAASGPLRQRMGAAARARVLRSFTWERASKDVAALHAEVLAG